MLQSNMGHIASRDTHSRSSKKPSLPLQKPTPSLSQYLPRPSQREGARACGPGECCIASALAVNTARGVERASHFCTRSRGLVCGGIWKNIERASHFCARIRGFVRSDIWRNTEFASGLRSPPSEGSGEVFLFSKTTSATSSTFSTLFVVFFCSCSLFLGTLTG